MSTQRWTLRSVSGKDSSASPMHSRSKFQSEPSPHYPSKHRNRQPCRRRKAESQSRRPLDQQPDNDSESREPQASECGPGGIQRSRFPAAADPGYACLLFASPDMLLDQRRAGGKNRRKGEKQAPTTGPKRAAISPATTVTAPPRANLIRYSYQWVSRRADGLS